MAGNILVLSAGRRVSLLRGFQDAAGVREGMRVFAADARPALSAACQSADAAFELPRVNTPDYADALLKLCRENDIKLVVPTIDPELPVLAALQPAFAEEDIDLVVCAPSLVDAFADKRNTAEFFRERGLATPGLQSRDDLSYPVFVKPYDGSLSAGAMVVRGPEDLSPAMLANDRNLFCEYIDHEVYDEFTCDLYFDRRGALMCVVPRKRLEVRGGEVAKAEACKNDIVPRLFDVFGQLEGARGPLTLQLFRHRETGDAFFIEVNPRFGGGYPLSRHAGANFQEWLISEYLEGKPPTVFNDWEDGAIMLRYDDEVITRRT